MSRDFKWLHGVLYEGFEQVMALVVKSAVRTRLKGMRASGDFFKALDKHIAEEIAKAVARAKANGRKTLRPEDL